MKKFIIAVSIIVVLMFTGYHAYYKWGFYLPRFQNGTVDCFITTEGKTILKKEKGEFVPFEIRGVDLGSGYPGKWAVEYAIDQETYERWFGYMQDLGVNTIRIYTIHHQAFYDAFYDYNTKREQAGEEPLYLLQGVWIDDYTFNSHNSAFSKDLLDELINDSKHAVDVIHGQISLPMGSPVAGGGDYRKDVSKWVLGYLLGVEWENTLVAYTDQVDKDKAGYNGRYLYTTEDATPFESMLAQVGDKLIAYETGRYGQQRLVAFSNWPTTDPFVYPVLVTESMNKINCVDVEHIVSHDETFRSGMFASYHVYPYYPDYLNLMLAGGQDLDEAALARYGILRKGTLDSRIELLNGPKIEDWMQQEDLYDDKGELNTYRAYLTALNRYHTLPVVITEYGVSTARGMACLDSNTGRNQGNMSEEEQGQALIRCYEDIMAAGCAGSCVFTWQDEWFKRTWNTMAAVDRYNSPYWSDYQTNEQYFGFLSFAPGEEESICYVDGDLSEWTKDDLVIQNETMDLSMKYDEEFIYFLVHKEDFDKEKDILYIPIDTNSSIGSTYAVDQGAAFERAADFLLVINGEEESRLLVQERYEVLMAVYYELFYHMNPYYEENTPEADSPVFKEINMTLQTDHVLMPMDENGQVITGMSFETGLLRYGNGNPESPDFDSLADFIFAGDYVEIRLPWQLLNFANPPEMMIHDDYYQCYGIEYIPIDKMYVGVGSTDDLEYRIPMAEFSLKGWKKQITFHERLKQSYYMLQEYWRGLEQQQ